MQQSSGARCLIFCPTFCLLPFFMCATNEGSGKTVPMRRLAWAFTIPYVLSTLISWAGSIMLSKFAEALWMGVGLHEKSWRNSKPYENSVHVYHGHQPFIAYTNVTKLSVSCFWEQNLEIGQCYMLRHSLSFWTLLSVFNEYVTRELKMAWHGEKGTFSNFNTDFRVKYVSWQNNYLMSKVDFQATV